MILLQRYEGQERGAHAETVMPADLVMRCGTQLSLYKYETWIGGGNERKILRYFRCGGETGKEDSICFDCGNI